jgi:Bacterial protein of unknown function (HtrL_YibB)
MKATIVTALFKIPDRNTHKYEAYKLWCKHISGLDTPLIAYVDDYYHAIFINYRERIDPHFNKTIIHKLALEDLEVYRKYGPVIANVMQSGTFKSKIQFPNVPEMSFAWYNIIMYNKLCFLREASLVNQFSTDTFCWLDAGAIRSPSKDCHMLNWPNNFEKVSPNKMNMFTILGKPSFTCGDTERYFKHCFGQWRFIQGGCFIGDMHSIHLMYLAFFKTLEWCLANNVLGSDEKLFDFCYVQEPESFNLIETTPPNQWTQFFDILY